MKTVALLDFPTAVRGTRTLAFRDDAALDGVDLVVWAADGLAGGYDASLTSDGRRVLTADASHRLVRDDRRWAAAFETLVASGGTVAVFAPAVAHIGLHTLQEVVDHTFAAVLAPICRLRATELPSTGSVASAAGEPFASFFAAFGHRFVATQALDAAASLTIAAARPSGHAVGLYRTRHPGRVLVLPTLADDLDAPALHALVDGTARLVARLRAHAPRPPASTDARDTDSPRLRTLRDELAAVARTQERLAAEQASLVERIDALAMLEALAGDDRADAAQAAAHVLHGLGAYVQRGVDHPGAVLVEATSGVGLLVAIDGSDDLRDPRRLAPDLHDVAAGWNHRDDVEPVVVLLPVGPSFPLPSTARTVSVDALLDAHRTRDTAFVDRLLAA